MKINKDRLHDNIWTAVFFVLIGVLTVLIFLLIGGFREEEQETETIIGAVFIGNINDGGWNQKHAEGLRKACEETGATLLTKVNIDEDAASLRPAVKELVNDGCKSIFLTSDGFGDNIREVTDDYSDVFFYTVSPEASGKNVTTYYSRAYQTRYMAGIIAGTMTKSNVLGYIAAMNVPQVTRGINAYSMGARAVNPEAVVKVIFTNNWDMPNEEREAAQRLIDECGADVITSHTSYPYAVEIAEENDIYSIGYNTTGSEVRSDKYLATIAFHWEVLYKAILQDAIRGVASRDNTYWWGVAEGVVALEDYSKLVDDNTRKNIKRVRSRFVKGYDVFLGRIVGNNGKVICEEDERVSDEALLFDMDWLVEGVEIYGK